MELFGEFDRFLLIFGLKIVIKSRKMQVANLLIKFTVRLLASCALIKTVVNNNFSLIFETSYEYEDFIFQSMILVMMFRISSITSAIGKLISQITEVLDHKHLEKMSIIAKALIAILFAHFLIDVLFNLRIWCHTGTRFIDHASCYVHFIFNCLFGGWFNLTMVFVYLYFVILISKLKGDFLGNCDYKKKPDEEKMRILWRKIVEISFEFEQLFNLFPLIWFINIFCKSTAYLIGARKGNQAESMGFLIRCYFFLIEAIFPSLVILILDGMNVKLERLLNRITKRKLKSSNESISSELIEQVSDGLEMRFTGWSMFPLRKTFLLGFLSSLISFSVLFMQLT